VEHFIEKHAARSGRAIGALDADAVAWLTGYRWPGNVRELENTIERAVVLTAGSTITRDVLTVDPPRPRDADRLPSLKLRQNVEWIERTTIRRALAASSAKQDAARLMGISPRALSHYLAKYPLIMTNDECQMPNA